MSRYINPDSDGKFYSLNDMARTDCHDCTGCSDCCEGMGDSILIDPYDIYQFNQNLFSFDQLLSKGYIELSLDKGLIVPHIKMSDFTDACPFLKEKRCSVHDYRPGMCRLFPLGRDYTEGKLEYILLDKSCPKTDRSKVKINKWIGIEPAKKYHEYLQTWQQMAEVIAAATEEQAHELTMRIMHSFYVSDYTVDRDFYEQFNERVNMYKRAFDL